jgi:hypothetical protein
MFPSVCCFLQVVTPGRYLVAAMYKSAFIRGLEADFVMSVGSHSQIKSMAAATKSAKLPALRSEEVSEKNKERHHAFAVCLNARQQLSSKSNRAAA